MKVRLTKNVRDMAGNVYPEGSVVDVLVAPDGIPEVVGAGYLPLRPTEWELALTDEDLERLLTER